MQKPPIRIYNIERETYFIPWRSENKNQTHRTILKINFETLVFVKFLHIVY